MRSVRQLNLVVSTIEEEEAEEWDVGEEFYVENKTHYFPVKRTLDLLQAEIRI